MSLKYLLDANIFIQANNQHYGFDFCPAFWEWLVIQSDSGIVGSLSSIKKELLEKDDDVSRWVRNEGRNLFVDVDLATTKKFPIVTEWVDKQKNYSNNAKAKFLQVDFQLVAYASVHGCTVVTHEVSAKDSKKAVKIPDVCEGFGVACASPYEMLQNEGARFVLSEMNKKRKDRLL